MVSDLQSWTREGQLLGLVHKALALCLILLLVTLDYTLMASIVTFERSAGIWSPWLYKTGLLTLADIIILTITVVTMFNIIIRLSFPWSNYVAICLLVLVYLFIGLIQNLTIFTWWKGYLYDFKVFLCLTVPYLFLRMVPAGNILKWFSIPRLLMYGAIAGVVDTLVAHALFESSLGISIGYPQYLNLPVVAPIFPLQVSAIGILFAHKLRYKMIFLSLFLFELVNHINKISLGYISTLVMLTALLFAFYPRVRLIGRTGLILSGILAVECLFVLLISNPFQVALLAEKSAGAVARSIELENVLHSFGQNIPGFIGKGWGSSWFEYVRGPEGDIYSVGSSMGANIEEAMSLPVRFVFHWQPPAMLYKWGILGIVLLSFLIAKYYQDLSRQIRKLKDLGLNAIDARYLYAILIISCYFITADFLWNTSLRESVFVSLLVFSTEDEIRKRWAKLTGVRPLEPRVL